MKNWKLSIPIKNELNELSKKIKAILKEGFTKDLITNIEYS